MNTDTGGPAFPLPPCGTGDPRDGMAGGSLGMSLRDYLAAHASEADVEEFVDYSEARKMDRLIATKEDRAAFDKAWKRARAEAKFRYADAMLAARNGGSK